METVISENQIETKAHCVITDQVSNMVKAMSVLFETEEGDSPNECTDPTMWKDMETEEVEMALHHLPV
jgi:hypothetical protein